MNVIKHMEAAFLFSLSVAGVASVLADSIPTAQAQPVTTVVRVASNAGMPVVHVTAKRLSAAEKQRMLAQEARGSRA
jgi:hypothetical protein